MDTKSELVEVRRLRIFKAAIARPSDYWKLAAPLFKLKMTTKST